MQYLLRETLIGVFLGMLYGALIGAYTAVAYGDSATVMELALTVGISVLASMASSAQWGLSHHYCFIGCELTQPLRQDNRDHISRRARYSRLFLDCDAHSWLTHMTREGVVLKTRAS